MEFEDFKAQGLRVTMEFHDQYQTEVANPALKDLPPPPFMKWVDYKVFVGSQIGFTSKDIPSLTHFWWYLETFCA